MNLFCSSCSNLLIFINESDRTIKKCEACLETYPTTDEDSLRYQHTKKMSTGFDKTTVKNAGDDPMNKKIKKNCTECKSKFSRLYRTPDMTTYLVCSECHVIKPYRSE